MLQLKSAWRDGTTHIKMPPLYFMQRLAALVPRPCLAHRRNLAMMQSTMSMARHRAHRRDRWIYSKRPDTQGKTGSATVPASRLGPRSPEAVKVRRSEVIRGDVELTKASQEENFHETPRD